MRGVIECGKQGYPHAIEQQAGATIKVTGVAAKVCCVHVQNTGMS
jgi:hypothetical protein